MDRYLRKPFEASDRRRISIPLNVNTAEAIRAITVNGRCDRTEEILRGIEEAVVKARKFFL